MRAEPVLQPEQRGALTTKELRRDLTILQHACDSLIGLKPADPNDSQSRDDTRNLLREFEGMRGFFRDGRIKYQNRAKILLAVAAGVALAFLNLLKLPAGLLVFPFLFPALVSVYQWSVAGDQYASLETDCDNLIKTIRTWCHSLPAGNPTAAFDAATAELDEAHGTTSSTRVRVVPPAPAPEAQDAQELPAGDANATLEAKEPKR